MDHWIHVGAERNATLPSQNGTWRSVSWPSFGASDAFVMRSWTCARPARPPSLEKPPSHSPASFCSSSLPVPEYVYVVRPPLASVEVPSQPREL